jgi:hypothetical protein
MLMMCMLYLHPLLIQHPQYTSLELNFRRYHSDLNSGWNVNTSIAIQKTSSGAYKLYTIIYFVFEKVYACDMYPPNNQVTFYGILSLNLSPACTISQAENKSLIFNKDIVTEYDGAAVTPKWTTSYVDDVCNNRAKVLNNTAIQITWTSS